ncbi:MAG TPA: hypothetical protein VEI02_00845 [Planctomycetota bacterium]|nr:hypothetical protein [Planctomycetota bacterium]
MARILIAASPEPSAILRRILDGHDLVFAATVEAVEAELHASPHFDLVVCTIVFDESRMFDLLRLLKARPDWRDIPFVCAKVRPNLLVSPLALEAVAFTCRTLGAAAFIDIAEFETEPERRFRENLERHLRPVA